MKTRLNFFVLSALALSLGMAIVAVSVSKASAQQAELQPTKATEPSFAPILNPQEELSNSEEVVVPGQNSDYFLAYPGILPDHPFYWLKMIRDRLLLILSTSSNQKTEKLLLYADKRLGAGKTLIIEKNKTQLGITTITKGEKYLEKAVWEWNKTKDQELKEQLLGAVNKHQEVLGEVEIKTKGFEDLFKQMNDKLSEFGNLLE